MADVFEASLYLWVSHFLFYLGALLVPLALFLIVSPAAVMRLANRVNRWINTKPVFDYMNRPHYQERLFYRHHRLFGGLIVLLSGLCLYLLGLYMGQERLMDVIHRVADSEFARWLILDLYYVLLAGLAICLITGLVIVIRPSLLKPLETWSNRWLDVEAGLESFDSIHEIPIRILPGRLRLLGLFVLAGAAYMMYVTGGVIF